MTSCCSVASRTVRVLGTATWIPDCSTGAVSMKITSSTSTTSTSGVMLISASAVCVCPLLLVNATDISWVLIGLQRRFFHAVQQLAGKVVHTRSEVPHPCRELVVSHDRRNRDQQ